MNAKELLGLLEKKAFVIYGTGHVAQKFLKVIQKEHLDKIWNRFYRVDKSHSKEIGGTGLGLSIVKHGVAYHGAEIKIESELGTGTKVTVAFKKNRDCI